MNTGDMPSEGLRAGRVATQARAGAQSDADRDTREDTKEDTRTRPDNVTLAAEAPPKVREAIETAAEEAAKTRGLGRPGSPINRRSPFFIGMTAAAGVAITYAVVELLLKARGVLILIGLALFIAVGLEPAVASLTRRGLPRWAAVLAVVVAALGVVGAFIGSAIPPLAAQTTALINHFPQYMHQLQNHNSQLGRLNNRFHIQQRVTSLLSTRGSSLIGGVIGAGAMVLSAVGTTFTVIIMSIYFLASLPMIRLFFYRLVPHSRRPRVILIGDEILAKVGGYVLGNVFTSVVAGLGTFFWMIAFGIPYPLLLGLLVAILDLIPIIGSTIGGAIVSLVALTVSLPVAIATLGFYIGYRLAEDYLLVPRVMGHTVKVPNVATLVSLLIGGALLGIVGALIAIPVAAAIQLLLNEVTFPRLDAS